MAEELAGFKHRFVSGSGQEGPTLLLLHGTGGNENDLLPLGRELLPGANLLSPRGKILEHGMPRFFRRLAEGVFDEEDLKIRTEELAGFVEEASERYGFDPGELFAVGFSNGANIAASLLLSRPELLRGAVLLRAMVPFEPEEAPDLSGVRIFVAAGELDHMVPKENTERLVELLRESGAELQVGWQRTGHGLVGEEVEEAKRWLSGAAQPH
ncbi:MAG TPA: alpha/beta hydrolase [Rubrobacter sp.]|nr:alpha/beta hydrolase [Rubrobacter sp.]